MSILDPIPVDPGVRIIRRCAYVDTIGVYISRHLRKHEREILEGLCGKVTSSSADAYFKLDSEWKRYFARVTIHQPGKEAPRYLEDLFPNKPPQVNRIDFSLDWTTESDSDANEAQRYLAATLIKRWHREKHKILAYQEDDDESLYIGATSRTSRFALYSDLPSKISGGPCCHLELRLFSRKAVKGAGVNTLGDIVNFDHRKLWKEKLQLRQLDKIRYGKRMSGRHFNTPSQHWDWCGKRHNKDLMVANRLIRGIALLSNPPQDPKDLSLMAILSASKARLGDVSGILRKIDATTLLPVCPRRLTR